VEIEVGSRSSGPLGLSAGSPSTGWLGRAVGFDCGAPCE